jgi:hypothetical protein
MDTNFASYALEYAGILIEAALVLYLACSSRRKGLGCVAFYLTSLLVAECARACVLRVGGYRSAEYLYTYWSTDLLLVTSALLVVCLFFRRACSHEERLWRFIRVLLPFTFILVTAISLLLFTRNYKDLYFSYFILEFNQNLYFTCLVLNTLLYLLLQYIESTDDQLGLLVCGVGIQFAGPAATLALMHLTSGQPFAQSLNSLIMRLCALGMLLVWAYAIVRVKDKAVQVPRRKLPALAGVVANLNV